MQTLKDLFSHELDEIYNVKNQIAIAYPRLIKASTSTELKDALSKYLQEIETHLQKLNRIFFLLSQKPPESICHGVEGLIGETDELIALYKDSPPTLDAAIISSAQKMEHYEIASYGTLLSFAKQMTFDTEIIDLLKQLLEEEGAADKKLTKLAEGSVFGGGINKDAVEKK